MTLEPEPEDYRPPAFTDEALALRFAERHDGLLRYVEAWGRWLSFDRVCWCFDDTLLAFDRARKICREAAAECNDEKIKRLLASAKSVAAVVTLAKADRRLAATTGQWDADPWLLNTPAGVIDLRTGKIRTARPTGYLTKSTAVARNRNCPIPTWKAFLNRICGYDAGLIGFLQRMAGYTLTGSTQEHALFFLYGTGANGKSTFINALIGVTGDYHRSAPIETFTASHTDHHPTDLAGLRGARLVTATETEEGRRWAESKIKALTGGDKIAARFMRQDFFEYVPQFKLVIAGNHRPGLQSVDEAIRRRLHLVPFKVTIPEGERDKKLSDRLGAELPGIMAWMIEGCLEWQKLGLAPPEAVTSATKTYLEAEDAIAAWIDDCCDHDPQAWEQTSRLFASWSTWANKAGEHVGSQKRFSERLEARGQPTGNTPSSQDEQCRLLPPLVRSPSTSKRCCDLAGKILKSIIPRVQPGTASTISDQEIEECIDATAVALCWHLSAVDDQTRRAELLKELTGKIFSLVCAIEAGGVALKKNITIEQALSEISERYCHVDKNSASDRTEQSTELQTKASAEPPIQGMAVQITTGNRRFPHSPPLVMPYWMSIRGCELVRSLLKSVGFNFSQAVSATSGEEIEEATRACQLTLCWLLAALNDPQRCDQIALRWLDEIPELVRFTAVVDFAEVEGITVIEAVEKLNRYTAMYEVQIDGETCAMWLNADGEPEISGPRELEYKMIGFIGASHFLRTISHIVGANVNALHPDILDGLLSKHHVELARLVQDGSVHDVSEEDFDTFVSRYANMSIRDLTCLLTRINHPDYLPKETDGFPQAMLRSALIRVHLLKAKIEERERERACNGVCH